MVGLVSGGVVTGSDVLVGSVSGGVITESEDMVGDVRDIARVLIELGCRFRVLSGSLG